METNPAEQGKSTTPTIPSPVPPAVTSIKSSSTTMWDAFEHILMFISLYVLAISIALTLKLFIDKWIPGVTKSYYYLSYETNLLKYTILRGYLAALIVSFPLFAFFFLNIVKRTMANPSMRNIKTRKILIYLTLIVAFIIMLTSIITTVFNFLNGNITLNFILHIIVIITVTGVVVGYYLYQIREDRKING